MSTPVNGGAAGGGTDFVGSIKALNDDLLASSLEAQQITHEANKDQIESSADTTATKSQVSAITHQGKTNNEMAGKFEY